MSDTRRLVLNVSTGSQAGSRFRVSGPVVVGRSPECDISIADLSVSQRHFDLVGEGDGWRIRDLGSRNGISVNGQRIQEGLVRAGDEIRAGEVVFRLEAVMKRISDATDHTAAQAVVHGDEAAAPLELFPTTQVMLSATAPAPAAGTLFAALTSCLRTEPSITLYALIDGAQAFELALAARLMGHSIYTVFSGELAEAAARVGPTLVVLGERSAFLRAWAEKAGSHAGVLFESAADFAALWAHLRHIFIATDEEGQEYFFRYYDPRVLRTFLPTCRGDELVEFFGPVERWLAESEDASAYLVYSLQDSRLTTSRIAEAQSA